MAGDVSVRHRVNILFTSIDVHRSLVFCVDRSTNGNADGDGIYRHFLDNEQTSSHRSVIFGLREMNSTETDQCCPGNRSFFARQPPITDRPFHFTSNYYLRTYRSSCLYLDEKNHWQTDGLRVSFDEMRERNGLHRCLQVGPLTNENRTHCYSTHLTTFASAFLSLPPPMLWNDLALADHSIDLTVVWTLIVCVLVLFVIIRREKCVC